ncbi:STAS domain-containing protein [Acidobacterium sp. S8]|uniref:STAS domain-containing protein n=1 Tax=Acidobacterium sp. S8 TaxID=1641854 RepID=UPI0020B13E87|nr:STAS domain-containing protein [Acidobacterium sp. S8]
MKLTTVPGQAADSRILKLEGPLTLSNLFDFQAELRKDAATTILDLSDVPYMDSAGMGAIINYYVACQKGGRKLLVAGTNYRVMELFKLTKVDQLITLIESVEAAGE